MSLNSRVLFLDVDGVLNKNNTKERIPTVFGDFTGLDAVLIKRFTHWIRHNPTVDVVLSSSWRLDERYDGAFTKALNAAGITWIDKTCRIAAALDYGTRGLEINKWLTEHSEYTKIAILDDMGPVYFNPVQRYLVQTDDRHGLTARNLQRVEVLLGLIKKEEENSDASLHKEA
jgi:hypothetical protein